MYLILTALSCAAFSRHALQLYQPPSPGHRVQGSGSSERQCRFSGHFMTVFLLASAPVGRQARDTGSLMSADSWRTASSGQDVGLISRAECRGPIQVGWWYGEVTRYGQRGGDEEKYGGAGPINSANSQDVARYSIL